MIVKEVETVLKKSELSSIIGVKPVTIERWVKKGMPHLKAPNGTIRFELEKVKEWLSGGNK